MSFGRRSGADKNSMVDAHSTPPGLRTHLRSATHDAHQALDDAMAQLDLARPRDYARFLQIQYAARIGVEAWLVRQAPAELTPPAQCPALAADLSALDRPLPLDQPLFDAPEHAEPLGVAWVLAGSSLGNRAMLADLRKGGHTDRPTAFLGNEEMAAFWHDFRPRIDTSEADGKAAVASARGTFAHFSAIAAAYLSQGAT